MTLRWVAGVAIVALSAGLHLWAEYHGPRWQVYLFKPLTTLLVLLIAGLSAGVHGPRYQVAIVLGLACSLLGDVLLMLPGDRFLPGLVSFLVAHLAYLAAFATGVPPGAAPAITIPLALVLILLVRFLWAGAGRLRLPVLLYAATIFMMVLQALGRALALSTPGATLAATGATLFMTSDAILAVNRFRRPLPIAQVLIMVSYVAAQTLIALSVSIP